MQVWLQGGPLQTHLLAVTFCNGVCAEGWECGKLGQDHGTKAKLTAWQQMAGLSLLTYPGGKYRQPSAQR